MDRKVIANVKKASINKINIDQKGYPSPQSFCVIKSDNRVIIHKHTNEKSAEIVRYSASKRMSDKKVNGKKTRGHSSELGHCNGCTYCDRSNEIIVTRYRNDKNTKKVAVFDADTFKYKRTITLPVKVSGVAYDRVTGDFYVSKGNTLHVFSYDEFMKGRNIKATYQCKFGGTSQDIGGYDGLIYKIKTVKKGKNYIDCYRAKDGQYVGSISVPFYELESCAVDENNILHMVFTNDRYLVKTQLNTDAVFKTNNRI